MSVRLFIYSNSHYYCLYTTKIVLKCVFLKIIY